MIVHLTLLLTATSACSTPCCIASSCLGGAALVGLGVHHNRRKEREVAKPICAATGQEMTGNWGGRNAVLRLERNRQVSREDGTFLFVVGESGFAPWSAGYQPPTGTEGFQRAVVTKAWWGLDEESFVPFLSGTGYDSTLDAQRFIDTDYNEGPWFPTYDPFPEQTKIHVIEWKLMDRDDAEAEIRRIREAIRLRDLQSRQALEIVQQQPAYNAPNTDRDVNPYPTPAGYGGYDTPYAGGYGGGYDAGYSAGPDLLDMALVGAVTDDPMAVLAVGAGADPLAVVVFDEFVAPDLFGGGDGGGFGDLF